MDDESGWEDGKVKTQLSKLPERIYTRGLQQARLRCDHPVARPRLGRTELGRKTRFGHNGGMVSRESGKAR